jgi:hypothetical protein
MISDGATSIGGQMTVSTARLQTLYQQLPPSKPFPICFQKAISLGLAPLTRNNHH